MSSKARLSGWAGFFVCFACCVGCGPSTTGAFDDKGYKQLIHGYRVAGRHAEDASVPQESLLGSDWKLDNFYYENGGKSLVQKTSPEYRISYELDYNDDGKIDLTSEEFLYDLRFTHLKRDGVIWLRTVPLSDDLKTFRRHHGCAADCESCTPARGELSTAHVGAL